MRKGLNVLLCLVAALAAGHAYADSGPAIAVDPAVGPRGTTVNYTGVGFTPNGRVQVLFVAGLGLVVGDVKAGPTGVLTGSFAVPSQGAELTLGVQEVSAIDQATGRQSLPALFTLISGPPLDYDLPDGHFYTQANGQSGGRGSGYPLVNSVPYSQAVNFFGEFKRVGGATSVGYPASRTFVLDGFVTQAFQKAVFQWRPEVEEAYFLNVFDLLHDRGFDPLLLTLRSVPLQLASGFDAGKSSTQVVADRLALLADNAAIEAVYYSVQNPLLRFGLPTSRAQDMGSHFALRLQRAVIQQWKVDVPWAHAGQATVANGGDIFKELNQLPAFSMMPHPAPTFGSRVVVYQPSRGTTVSSPFSMVGEGQAFEAVVNYDLLDERGRVLAFGGAQARAAAPYYGRFETPISFSVEHQQTGILRVFLITMRDGSVMPQTIAAIPLTLRP